MKYLLLIILAGCAVRCEDNSYYVVEVPNEARSDKPFKVYWNVPTMQCRSKKIPFTDLYEKYGIIQNADDRFKGEKVVILYDPGDFPALFKNESSGKFRFRNGGVPQEGDLDKHLVKFKLDLEESIPNEGFDGVGIIDFESWRPVYRQNFYKLRPYQDVSVEIERALHPWWMQTTIEAEAERRFTLAARTFMETTILMAKRLRPQALWGFYGFPYCFNMATNNMHESCDKKVPKENDHIRWLWSSSTALYPSLYSSESLSSSQQQSLIRGRIKEASRLKQNNILPYFWYRHRDGGFLTQQNLDMSLSTIYKSPASGIIIWGSSHDVNTVEKCKKLCDYVENIFGPTIAKYTKPKRFNDLDEKLNEINDITLNITIDNNGTTETSLTLSNFNNTDVDQDYNPPKDYTDDLKKLVKENINNKFGQNSSTDAPLVHSNIFFDNLLNYVLNVDRNSSDNLNGDEENLDISSITENIANTASQVTINLVTNSEISYSNTELNLDKITSTESTKLSDDTTEIYTYLSNRKEISINLDYADNETVLDNYDTFQKTTENSKRHETTESIEEKDFFNRDTFFKDYTTNRNEFIPDLLSTGINNESVNLEDSISEEFNLESEPTTEIFNAFENTSKLGDTENSTDYITTDSDSKSITEYNHLLELFTSTTVSPTTDKTTTDSNTSMVFEPIFVEKSKHLENVETSTQHSEKYGQDLEVKTDFGNTRANTEASIASHVFTTEQVDFL